MTTTNEALADELEAVNSIFDAGTLVISGQELVTSTILSLPNLPFSFLISFPAEYPDAPPEIITTQSTGQSTKKGEGDIALQILRDTLGRIFVPGQVCLFDLIEETIPLLQVHKGNSSDEISTTPDGSSQDRSENSPNRSAQSLPQLETLNIRDLTSASSTAASSIIPPKWILSEPLVVSKSRFIARALRITSLDQATDSISHLLATDKKVASATHNITAWRIKQKQVTSSTSSDGAEVVIQDCDDDGETAAGGRLLHLMQLMDVWNVVVVVTRWYGGVKLGPDRFRLVNSVAREALVNGGFAKEEEVKGKGKGKKK